MPSPLSKKLELTNRERPVLVGAHPDIARLIEVPVVEGPGTLDRTFDFIQYFATRRSDLENAFPQLRDHLDLGGSLWISWRKGRPKGTDLSLPNVIEIGYGHGMVESKCVSVDSEWSALKFTFPISGKVYDNSYGQLKAADSGLR